ncbi:hypothetical protein ACF0H5_005965 [Mactra antiquata]
MLLSLIFLSFLSGSFAVYRPSIGDVFQWQLQVDDNHPFDYSMHADLYDVDLWAVTPQQIAAIHAKGAKVICYFSAGSLDNNRPDAHLFHSNDIGNKMDGWDEHWIDIRSSNVKSIMAKRMDLAKSKNCDGIEPDNVDGYDSGNAHIGFSFHDQLVYNRWLADQAHARGLSIGLKNDVGQIQQLHSSFDWALNEECHDYDECMEYQTFLDEGKAVFNVEYVNSHHVSSTKQQMCTRNSPTGMRTQFKVWDVTSWVWRCPNQ